MKDTGGEDLSTLTDADIRAALQRSEMDIEPFREDQLTPNGYDLSIAEVMLPDTGHTFKAGTAVVPPLTRFMVSTEERVRLGPAMSAQLWLRTSWARRGVLASFGRIDAGFDGTLTFGAFNSSADRLDVPLGETFAQIVVESMSGSAEADYSERSGHYQHQRGVTMAVVENDGDDDDDDGDDDDDDDDDDNDDVQMGDRGAPEFRVVPAPCLEVDCHECCIETEMPLSRRDVERLQGRGHDPAGFTLMEDGFTFLTNVDGRCFFLDASGHCSEYSNRPEGCRLYPLVLDAEMTEFDMDHLCPHTASVQAGSIDETALLELLDRIAKDRASD